MLVFLDSLSSFIKKFSTKRNIIIGLLTIIFFNIILFPVIPKLFGVNVFFPLDLSFAYSSQEAYAFLSNMSEKERDVYFFSEIFVDFPYAIIYTFVYLLLVYRLSSNLSASKNKYFLAVPLLIGFFDVLENLFIIFILKFYPIKLYSLSFMASIFTSCKWIFAILTFVVIVWLSAVYLLRK